MVGYVITLIITATACATATAVLAERTVRLIMRQVKLSHSITLVELKTGKVVYWIFSAVIGILIFYTVMQMADAQAPTTTDFAELFGVSRLYANLALMFVLIVCLAAEAFIITLGLSKNAVVDKGIYTDFDMLDWHQVRDYIINEDKGILILTTDKNTFSTLRHITTPFRVSQGDIQKLKFILNKNKNKFSEFDTVVETELHK